MHIFNKFRRVFLTFGVIIWIATLSPEVIVKSGDGCIFNENGEALTKEEAHDFMEDYFYSKDKKIENVEFKLGLLDFFYNN